MPRKTPPFPNYPEWTTAKFFSFVRSGLRAKWLRWPPRFEALQQARTTVSGKRHRYEYECAECHAGFKQTEVQVDHIKPVGSLNTYADAPTFIENLFTSVDNLRVLCKPCHKAITAKARKEKKNEQP